MGQELEQQILGYVGNEQLSDIHIHTDCPLALRIDGNIVWAKDLPIEINDIESFAERNLSRQMLERWRRDKSVDIDLACEKHRFRANFYFASGKPALVLRRIKDRIPTLEDLGLPEHIKTFLDQRNGLILVSGITGAGKSTTLAAMMRHVLDSRAIHAITIEDPIEYQFRSEQSVVSQRQIGTDANCFASALRSALREDFDVMLIGEMRDVETIELAMTAAELGHLVMGTLHASSCAMAVSRLINVFPANARDNVCSRAGDNLGLVINQQLFQRADSVGRVAAFEILIATPAVRNLIRENKIFHLASVMETSKSEGMTTMNAALQRLRESGEIKNEAV